MTVVDAYAEVAEQCQNVIDAHKRRNSDSAWLTLAEKQELAVLRIRLEDLDEVWTP